MDKIAIEDIVVGDVLRKDNPSKPVVTINQNTTIEEALRVLADKTILSVPVYNTETQELEGVLDLYEILAFTAFATHDDSQFLSAIDWSIPASDLIGTSGVAGGDEVQGLWEVQDSDSIQKPLEFLAKGVYRFIVKTTDGLRILSQSDLLRFFFNRLDEFEFANVSIESAGVGTYPCLTLPFATTALDGIRKIRIHEVHTLALIDKEGKLRASFSETELRGLSQSTIETLLKSSEEFVLSHYNGHFPPLVTTNPSELLTAVIHKMVTNRLHHIFVSDNEKPLGVITISDILLFFWNNLMSVWTVDTQ